MINGTSPTKFKDLPSSLNAQAAQLFLGRAPGILEGQGSRERARCEGKRGRVLTPVLAAAAQGRTDTPQAQGLARLCPSQATESTGQQQQR